MKTKHFVREELTNVSFYPLKRKWAIIGDWHFLHKILLL
jgi:hypothetical protein